MDPDPEDLVLTAVPDIIPADPGPAAPDAECFPVFAAEEVA